MQLAVDLHFEVTTHTAMVYGVWLYMPGPAKVDLQL